MEKTLMENVMSKVEVQVDGTKVKVDVDINSEVHAVIILEELMTMFLEDDIENGLAIIETAKDLALSKLAEKTAKKAVASIMSNKDIKNKFDELIKEILK